MESPDNKRVYPLSSLGKLQNCSYYNSNANVRPHENKKELRQYRGKRLDVTWCTDELNISSSHPEENELSDWTTSHFHSASEHVWFEMDRSADMKRTADCRSRRFVRSVLNPSEEFSMA
ncbi:hypothetical protein KIN20_029251 [Parelaphostrongylus tenuis]|uniref:Uncharacterized protein n=1 Tax=Parelaphostrongylus tenuis TaxID=148309 RepID=A0AAD5R2W7_PARTN|nr:hypothetical protein KIN20_029251 [Parelaphostrongylus tenuis]